MTVDPRWESFGAFLADMGEKPEGMTLERVDSTAPYGPGNCRWAGWSAQNNNRSTNQPVTMDGRTQTVTEWARERGLQPKTVFTRVYKGWPVEKALSTPVFAEKNGWQQRRAKAAMLPVSPGRDQGRHRPAAEGMFTNAC